MKTLSLVDAGDNDGVIDTAVTSLRGGGVIVYPTDTVYGLGADATNEDAVGLVRRLKGREDDKPILALVSDMNMLEAYAYVTPLAHALAHTFLPGPLSLVLTAKDTQLQPVMSPDESVGFRMPAHPISLALAKGLGRPITSTSVNRSGQPQPRQLEAMIDQLATQERDNLDIVIDNGELKASPPSTIIDARGEKAIVLREGAILRTALSTFL